MTDPTRWEDPGSDAPSGARELLASARRPALSPEARARSAARVAALGPPPTPSTVGPRAWLRTLGKVGLGLAVMTTAGLGLHRILAHDPTAPARTVMAHAPAMPAPPRIEPPAPALDPGGISQDEVEAARRTPPESAVATAPTARPEVHPAAPTVPGTHTGVPDPADEQRLLEQARSAADANPTLALARLHEHARMFPHSQFTQEREFITVRALIRAHRGAEARARGERFIARFPHGIYTESVRRLMQGAH